MRKLFILLLFCFSMKGFGQTYTVNISYKSNTCIGELFDCDFFGCTTVFDYVGAGSGSKVVITPICNSFKLSLYSACEGEVNNSISCSYSQSLTKTDSELILLNSIFLSGCNGNIVVSSFKPNVTIQKSNALTTVCSGDMLDLAGFPADFPDEAYHWQYSLDNQQTWIDVPANFNNNPTTNFLIQDILGDSHVNYFGEQLYFRLGYDQNRPFTEPLAITYSPCAPVVKNIQYFGPKCNEGLIEKVIVTFDRPLDKVQNEKLVNFTILNNVTKTVTPDGFQLDGVVSKFDGEDILSKTFTLNNIENRLIAGNTYVIKYTAHLGTIAKGTQISKTIITHSEPPPVTWEAFPVNVQCFGGDGMITINAHGGSGDYYKYSIDGGAEIQFKNKTVTDLNGLRTGIETVLVKSLPSPHIIKVTDIYDCIEKQQ